MPTKNETQDAADDLEAFLAQKKKETEADQAKFAEPEPKPQVNIMQQRATDAIKMQPAQKRRFGESSDEDNVKSSKSSDSDFKPSKKA